MGDGFPTHQASTTRDGGVCLPRLYTVSAGTGRRDPGRGGAGSCGGVAGVLDNSPCNRSRVYGSCAVSAWAVVSAAGGTRGRPLRSQACDSVVLFGAGGVYGGAAGAGAGGDASHSLCLRCTFSDRDGE